MPRVFGGLHSSRNTATSPRNVWIPAPACDSNYERPLLNFQWESSFTNGMGMSFFLGSTLGTPIISIKINHVSGIWRFPPFCRESVGFLMDFSWISHLRHFQCHLGSFLVSVVAAKDGCFKWLTQLGTARQLAGHKKFHCISLCHSNVYANYTCARCSWHLPYWLAALLLRCMWRSQWKQPRCGWKRHRNEQLGVSYWQKFDAPTPDFQHEPWPLRLTANN